MKLVDYLNLARERILVVLLVLAVSVATVVSLTLVQDPQYVAQVRLRALPPAPGSAASEIVAEQEQTNLGTEAQLVRSVAVARAVATRIGFTGDVDHLLDRVDVVVVPDTAVLLLTARGPDEATAVSTANAFAEDYLVTRRETVSSALDAESERQSARVQELVERLTELDAAIDGLEPGSGPASAAQAERTRVLTDLIAARSRLDALSDRAAAAEGFGEVIQPASGASAVRSTSVPRAVVFGLLLGVPLALAVVLLLDSLSNAVRGRQDVERATGVEVIGSIPLDVSWGDPASARLVAVSDPFSPAGESYRALGFTLVRMLDDAGWHSVLVTGAGDGDGKSATTANLAVITADGGRPVGVVDADLRNSRLHAFFGVPGRPGLSDVLAGEASFDGAMTSVGRNLEVLAAGRPTDRPDLLFARADIATVLGAFDAVDGIPDENGGRRPLRARASGTDHERLVFVDAAGVLNAAEVSRLAAAVDAVVLVARANVTARSALAAAAEQIRRAGGRLVGVVLIGRSAMEAPVSPVAASSVPGATVASGVG